MKYGIAMFPTDYAIPVPELAKACEDLGFESLLFPEHTHIPTSRKSPWGGGAELPKQYWHTLDPFVAMTAAAMATTTLKVGTGICLVIQRDVITTAKEVASVDHISGGRVLFGIGGGWNIEEMENHGTDPKTRWTRMRESIEAMKVIWNEDEPEYHGKVIDFDPIWQWPKPVQKPNPPVLVGGNGPRTLKRVVRYGDEWMPIYGRGNIESITGRIPELQALAKEAGRDPIPVTTFGGPTDPAELERLEAAGVHRVCFVLPSVDTEEALSRLKHYAELIR